MNPTFASFSFGCRVNEAEKVIMDKKLCSMGFLYDEINPQVFIINTCAVTGKAERQVRQFIYQTRKKYPNTKIVITGCAGTLWDNQKIILKEVDYVIPNSNKSQIPEFIVTTIFSSSPLKHKDITLGKINLGQKHSEHDKFLRSGRVMIKIQDGCNRFCSYCIVPLVRGLPLSRSVKDIVEEINRYEDSIQEVILTAINTDCFGKDTGETLIELINAVLTKTSTPTLSFGSIHPWSITDEFISYYQSITHTQRFIPFFHIPIQSGSQSVLKRMNRHYDVSDILKKMKKIKEISPTAFIGTDIIVGFPGETKKEFEETHTFLTNAPIDKIHVFRYSPRPGTKADEMKTIWKEVSSEEKRIRSKLLIQLSKDYHLK